MVRTAPAVARSETPNDVDRLIRRRIVCRGTVQGVGFRPTVHRLAQALGLSGSVHNDAEGATIEIEGNAASVDAFLSCLSAEMPPLAHLESTSASDIAATGQIGFEVRSSTLGERRGALVPPDAKLCDACRREMETSGDRRHAYPFTTCTHCGPRFTLVATLPYDRSRTSMASFAMCAKCAAEYGDLRDRRYHAEPVCCPECGPHLVLQDGRGELLGEAQPALELARALLARGGILAVKGIGGFQLACRADDATAVKRMRSNKHRATKPFAVMARDVATARDLVELSDSDVELLDSARAPVLLAPRRGGKIASEVAPGLGDLGVMVPTTPLHVELFRRAAYDALVMTSGNVSDEPICRTDVEARARLGGLCDALLLHDREILRRCDDSVARTSTDGCIVVRRSRGYVPSPIPLPFEVSEPLLALGGHLQNTVALAVGGQAFVSQHIGDLDHEAAREFQIEVLAGLEDFLQARALTIVVDRHPDYPSTWLGERMATERGAELVRVQHHVAHAAATLGEHKLWPREGERAAAIVLDGTGFGPDGTAWGAEWIELGPDASWSRLAHAAKLPLIGGERAVREPWRVATAALVHEGMSKELHALPMALSVDRRSLNAVVGLSATGPFALANGAGRLFEAAGALLGAAVVNGYEGEVAARLEALAARAQRPGGIWHDVQLDPDVNELPSSRLLAALARRVLAGRERETCALEFHRTFCELAAELARRVFRTQVVALGGGCFVNRLLREHLTSALAQRGMRALLPIELPPGDGGLCYGQLVAAAAMLRSQTFARTGGL